MSWSSSTRQRAETLALGTELEPWYLAVSWSSSTRQRAEALASGTELEPDTWQRAGILVPGSELSCKHVWNGRKDGSSQLECVCDQQHLPSRPKRVFLVRMVQVYLLTRVYNQWTWVSKDKNNYVVGIDCIPFLHCKKRLAIFPSPAKMSLTKLLLAVNNSPAGMSQTKLFLAGNNLIIPGQGEFCKWHPGWGLENR